MKIQTINTNLDIYEDLSKKIVISMNMYQILVFQKL